MLEGLFRVFIETQGLILRLHMNFFFIEWHMKPISILFCGIGKRLGSNSRKGVRSSNHSLLQKHDHRKLFEMPTLDLTIPITRTPRIEQKPFSTTQPAHATKFQLIRDIRSI